MRIGTITVHNGYNYGASLQAYALVRFLREGGHDAALLDYRNPKIEQKQQQRPSSMCRIMRKLLAGKGYDLRKSRFDAFHGQIFAPDTRSMSSSQELEALNQCYDGFICGSDQIWNKTITDLDSAFFLSFAHEDKKRIAYAPSLGTRTIVDEDLFRQALGNLDVLSVREAYNAEDIARLSGKPCQVVADPVLLLEKKHWQTLAAQAAPIRPKGKYVFYYTLFPDESLFEYAKQVARSQKAVLVRLDILPAKALLKGCRSVAGKGIGPAEFISLLDGAAYVVTNSFHGTVFSVLLQKSFTVGLLTGKQAGKNLRITQLLEQLGLQDRILQERELKPLIQDWSSVEERQAQMQEHSAKYLRNALK